MGPLKERSEKLQKSIDAAYDKLNITHKAKQLAELDAHLAEADVWHDPNEAQRLTKHAALLRASLEPWMTLKAQADDIEELMELGDDSMVKEFDEQLSAMESELAGLRKEMLFDGPFDDHAAIVKISAGAGGTDAQDWAQMLERMYLRWAEKSGMKTEAIERSEGEEAGIKSATFSVVGRVCSAPMLMENYAPNMVCTDLSD